MAQLSCDNLTVGYEDNIVLEHISFCVNKGDYLCIIGENGSGKTTLMKTLLGLKKQMAGKIIWNEDLKMSGIGYLTQQSEIQREFPASVREVVLSGFQGNCGLRPFYNKREKEQSVIIMKKMGIDSYAKRSYRELSGGQQQRVLLARALCATDKMLFLDEPVSGLDPNVSREMYDMVQNLNKKDKVSVIMVSHDVHTSLQYASHVLKVGKEVFFGTKEEYFLHKNENSIEQEG